MSDKKAQHRGDRNGKPGQWKRTIGDESPKVVAYERKDRGNAIYLRWFVNGVQEGNRRILDGVRGEDGKTRDPLKELEAFEKATEYYKALQNGDPLPHDEDAQTKDENGPAPAKDLTLEEGFERIFDRAEGPYPDPDALHREDMLRAAEVIKAHLGAKTMWSSITAGKARKLWRGMLDAHLKTGIYGPRWAERVVGFLWRTARFLHIEEVLDPRFANKPADWHWHTELLGEWGKATDKDLLAQKDEDRPRHTEDELKAIVDRAIAFLEADVETRQAWRRGVKTDRMVDPRAALAAVLGVGQRLGQYVRGCRSDLDLSEVGRFKRGQLRVRGSPKKGGATVDLDPLSHRLVVRELTHGHLKHLEKAYQMGAIDDYPLVPAGQLVQGRAKPTTTSHQTVDWARKLFHRLERAAGVTPQKGRGFHGVRRYVTDVATDRDPKAAKVLLGHARNSRVAENNYLMKERMRDRRNAADIRQDVLEGDALAPDASTSTRSVDEEELIAAARANPKLAQVLIEMARAQGAA